MKTVRFLLLPVLVFSFSVTLLDAMKREMPIWDCAIDLDTLIHSNVISEDVLHSEEALNSLIIQFLVRGEYASLELLLKAFRGHRDCMKYSVIAHDRLVATISKLVHVKPQDFIKMYFETLPEDTLKMAIRFVYAITYQENLDAYDCVTLLCPKLYCDNPDCEPCLTIQSKPYPASPSERRQGSKSFLHLSLNFSNNLLCTEAMVPAVFSLLQPVLKRIDSWFGVKPAFDQVLPFGAIEISGNEYDASSWLYLLPGRVQQKVNKNSVSVGWWLGPVKMREEPDIDIELFEFHGDNLEMVI